MRLFYYLAVAYVFGPPCITKQYVHP